MLGTWGTFIGIFAKGGEWWRRMRFGSRRSFVILQLKQNHPKSVIRTEHTNSRLLLSFSCQSGIFSGILPTKPSRRSIVLRFAIETIHWMLSSHLKFVDVAMARQSKRAFSALENNVAPIRSRRNFSQRSPAMRPICSKRYERREHRKRAFYAEAK